MPCLREFFRTHAVFPRDVAAPTDRNAWELGRGAPRAREIEGVQDQALLPGGLFAPLEREPEWSYEATYDVPDLVGGLLGIQDAGSEGGGEDVSAAFDGVLSVEPVIDTVATYRPWHWHGDDGWGVVVHARPFLAVVAALMGEAERTSGRHMAFPVAARDLWAVLIDHEAFHLRVEIAATHLEAIHSKSLYREYFLGPAIAPNPWTAGKLEELLATWTEMQVPVYDARSLRAWKILTAAVGPGYSDWQAAEVPRTRDVMYDHLASDIAATASMWPQAPLQPYERAQIDPRLDDERYRPLFDEFLLERHPGLSHKVFDAWFSAEFQDDGAITIRGRRHPKTLTVQGRGSYSLSTSKKDGGTLIIPPHELRALARWLGFTSSGELREAVLRGLPRPARDSRPASAVG
jgi:hypothetical protein